MSKEIAVVHWQDGGVEKQARAYTLQMLSQLIETMNQKGFIYWVCLTQLNTIVPLTSHKPVTANAEPSEGIRKVDKPKPLEMSFKEVTRIDPIHHPPITIEQRDKAYRHYI